MCRATFIFNRSFLSRTAISALYSITPPARCEWTSPFRTPLAAGRSTRSASAPLRHPKICRSCDLSGQQAIKRIQANLRPGLERFAAGDQFVFAQKGDVGDHCFAFYHLRLGQSENVNNAEVDLTNFGRVIVDQADDTILEFREQMNFLMD